MNSENKQSHQNQTTTMKLEEGKRYVRRNGGITPPITRNGEMEWPWRCGEDWMEDTFTLGGFAYGAEQTSPFDIISEYIEQPELPDAVFYARKGTAGPLVECGSQEHAESMAKQLAITNPTSTCYVLKTIAIVTAPMPVPTITQTK